VLSGDYAAQGLSILAGPGRAGNRAEVSRRNPCFPHPIPPLPGESDNIVRPADDYREALTYREASTANATVNSSR